MRRELEKVLSGVLASIASAPVAGVLVGLLTPWFVGAPFGALIGGVIGFRWGYRRIDGAPEDYEPGAIPARSVRSAGDAAFLAGGFYSGGFLCTLFADALGGYTAPWRGEPWTIIPFLLIPFAAASGGWFLERLARQHLDPLPRTRAGLAFVMLLVLTMCLWWQYAVARDQAAARYPRRAPGSRAR